jgi:hypothetical protein
MKAAVDNNIEIYDRIAKDSVTDQKVRKVSKDTDRLCGTQGDVALMRLVKPVTYTFDNVSVEVTTEKGALIADGEDIQIAVGNTTGARHIIKGGRGVRVYASKTIHPLMGPMIEVDKGCTARLEHPEHAHWDLDEGLYQVSYPRDYQQADIARQQD